MCVPLWPQAVGTCHYCTSLAWCHSEYWKPIWCLIWLSSASFEVELTDLFNLGQIYPGLNLASSLVVWMNWMKGPLSRTCPKLSWFACGKRFQLSHLPIFHSLWFQCWKSAHFFPVNLAATVNLVAFKSDAISAGVTKSFNQNAIGTLTGFYLMSSLITIKAHLNKKVTILLLLWHGEFGWHIQYLCLVRRLSPWAPADHPATALSTCNLASITYTRHMPLSNPLIHRITTNPFLLS